MSLIRARVLIKRRLLFCKGKTAEDFPNENGKTVLRIDETSEAGSRFLLRSFSSSYMVNCEGKPANFNRENLGNKRDSFSLVANKFL